MPGIKEKADTVAGDRHQAIDFGLVLDHRSHMVMVCEANAALQQALGKLGQPAPEIVPVVVARRSRLDSGRHRSPAMLPLVSA